MIAKNYSRVVVQGQTSTEPMLMTLGGGIVENFAHDRFINAHVKQHITNAQAKERWKLTEQERRDILNRGQ